MVTGTTGHSWCSTTTVAASPLRQWVAALLDQCVLAAWALFWFGLALGPAGALVGGAGDVILIIVAVVGVLVLIGVQTVVLTRRSPSVGMWLGGVRIGPAADVDAEDALLHFFQFWATTVALALAPLIGPRKDEAFVVRAPDRRPARIGRLVLGMVLMLSPVPLVVALLG